MQREKKIEPKCFDSNLGLLIPVLRESSVSKQYWEGEGRIWSDF
jgi:hypothetical protein